MKKTLLIAAAIAVTALVCACGSKQAETPKQEPAQTEAPTAETPETQAAIAEEPETEAPAAEVTIDRFVGEWGDERSVYTIEKTGDTTADVTYHGSNSAREGRDGHGKGELKDGALYADVEYEDYMYPSEGGDPARMVIGTSTEVFTPAEAMPDDYECFEGEVFYGSLRANMTPDKLELYLKSDVIDPKAYLHLKSGMINNNGLASEYIFWYSDKIRLQEEDISWLSKEELRAARNEIYARHGRKFDDPEIQERFNKCSWYQGTVDPDKFDDSVLSEIEKDNIKTIEKVEKTK